MKVNHTIFGCVSKKFKFYLHLTGITGTLYEEQYTFVMISFSVLLRMKICRTKAVENIKTHILCSITFFPEKCTVYEITWKKYCRPGRAKMKIWRMHSACWILKATNTHSAYVILIAFPLQQCLYENASMLQDKYFVCLVIRCMLIYIELMNHTPYHVM